MEREDCLLHPTLTSCASTLATALPGDAELDLVLTEENTEQGMELEGVNLVFTENK